MNKKLIKLLRTRPIEIAHLMGFDDMGELHNTWLKEMMFSKDDLTILAHRGSYKTTSLSVAIALIMVLFPKRKILFIRKTDDDVIEVIKQVSNMLMTPLFSYIVQELYGIALAFRSLTAFKIDTNLCSSKKGAVQLLGIGTKGSLTGKHADIIFTDDIVNLKDRVSRAERDQTKLIYMELENVRNRGGRIVNTGTPWHKDDCITIMPNVELFDCYQTGLISQEKLNDIRQKMTPSLFSANYELKHIADEEALFTSPQFFSDSKLLLNGVCHIDASYGGADGTAFTIIKQQGDKFYVYGKRYQKHVDKCLSDIYMLQDRYKAGSIYCERNGDKGYLAKEMYEDGKIVHAYNENMNKYVKIASYLLKCWKNIYFLQDTDPDYLNEILDYTENAQHDDAPDSLASILRELTGKGKWII